MELSYMQMPLANKTKFMREVDSDGGAIAVLTSSWAGLLGHTIKRHHPQAAQVLPTPTDKWLLQGLRASLQNSLTHEAGSMLLQQLENFFSTALLFHSGQRFSAWQMRLWHSPCQRTPLRCN